MQKVAGRDLKVNYFEKGRAIWVVESHVNDEEHDIVLVLEIDMEQMLILEATIKFNRAPLNHCSQIEEKAGQLKGLKADQDFVRNAMKIFMGPYGCPNIMTLLNIAVPGIIYFYYPYKIKTGEIKYEQWDNMVRTELKNACLAHTLL